MASPHCGRRAGPVRPRKGGGFLGTNREIPGRVLWVDMRVCCCLEIRNRAVDLVVLRLPLARCGIFGRVAEDQLFFALERPDAVVSLLRTAPLVDY